MTDARQFDMPVVVLLGPRRGNRLGIANASAVGTAKARPLLRLGRRNGDCQQSGDAYQRPQPRKRRFHASIPHQSSAGLAKAGSDIRETQATGATPYLND